MRKSFQRRYEDANSVAAGAYKQFHQAADSFEVAAKLHKDTYDELQAQIDVLTSLAADVQRNGTRAQKNAQKLREFLA